MILSELISYNADIICLQEVDGGSIYENFIYPVLFCSGYEGYYSNKDSCQREGCAMFWLRNVFDVDTNDGITGRDDEDIIDKRVGDNVHSDGRRDKLQSFSIRDLFDLKYDCNNDNSSVNKRGDNTTNTNKGPSKNSRKILSHWDSIDGINSLLLDHDELRKVTMEKIGQVVQIATLRLKEPITRAKKGTTELMKLEKVVVANTHLFYHPMADHIRALQAYVVCRKIDEVRRCNIDNDQQYPHPFLLCGDLNSDPISGACTLLFTKTVHPEHHDCWKNLNQYKWDCGQSDFLIEHGYVGNDVGVTDLKYEQEAFDDAQQETDTDKCNPLLSLPSPPVISLPPSFPNLISGYIEMPKFTNYAVDFIDTLDYILASEASESEPFGFRRKVSAPMPTEEMITKYVAMPNECMPSDHVAIACDLEWDIV